MLLIDSCSKVINEFHEWLSQNGPESYDPYDLWSTKFGLIARKIYYNSKYTSLAFIAPILFIDTYFPQLRRIFVNPKRYPIADAHLILGYLNLYRSTLNDEYLSAGINVSENLINSSIKGFSGYCWGYPFNWQNSSGLWKENTPFITTTPYCFEAFLGLFDATHETKYLDIAYSISEFVYYDINYSEMNDKTLSASYSPFDNSKVINASAYCGFVFAEAYKRFQREEYREKAEKLIGFIIQTQKDDGSWIYALDNNNDNFIDNIHTCFILKNLIKANNVLNKSEVENSIKKGYDYYLKNLIDKKGHPKSFAKTGKYNPIKVDLYDYAEGITLGLLMRDKNNEAKELVKGLLNEVIINYLTKKGTFTSKVNNLGFKINIPYMRWSQSQLFYAFTSYISVNSNQPEQVK